MATEMQGLFRLLFIIIIFSGLSAKVSQIIEEQTTVRFRIYQTTNFCMKFVMTKFPMLQHLGLWGHTNQSYWKQTKYLHIKSLPSMYHLLTKVLLRNHIIDLLLMMIPTLVSAKPKVCLYGEILTFSPLWWQDKLYKFPTLYENLWDWLLISLELEFATFIYFRSSQFGKFITTLFILIFVYCLLQLSNWLFWSNMLMSNRFCQKLSLFKRRDISLRICAFIYISL